MDLAELKAELPGLYGELYAAAAAEGVQEGVRTERERVSSVLPRTSNSAVGQMVLDNIRAGVPMTDLARANYFVAQHRDLALVARTEAVVALVERGMGVQQ